MNRIVSSMIIKIIALVGGYFTAFATGQEISESFSYYIGIATGYVVKNGTPVSAILFAVCVIVFVISVFKSKRSETKRTGFFSAIRRIDWTLLIVWTFSIAFLCTYFTQYSPPYWMYLYIPNSVQLVTLTVFLYLIIMGVLADIISRIRDKQLLSTFYWIHFFKLYPLNKAPGFLMVVLLIGNLVLTLVALPNAMIYGLRDTGIPLLLFSVFTLTALTYLCSFMLSLSIQYQRANEEKVRSERLKSELITNVSHDIRTPLTTIINYVDLLKTIPDPSSELIEYIAILDKKSNRLKILIGDLMEASKAGTGNIEIMKKELDLSEIVGQVAGEFEDQFQSRKLTLVLRGTEQHVSVLTDDRHLWRVLENLFGNAAKFTLPGTRIFAEIEEREDCVVFSMKNTSENPIDIHGEDLTEQFLRGDRSRKTEGSGLGLYIARSLIELMGDHFAIRVTGDLFEVEICFIIKE